MTGSALGPLAIVLAAAVGALVVPPVPRPRTTPQPRGVRPRSSEWLLTAAAGASAAVAVLVVIGGALGTALAVAAGATVGHLVHRMESPGRRRRRETIEAGLPHCVDLLAACLASGQEAGRAVAEVARALDGPVAEELQAICFRLRLGIDPAAVWRTVADHPQLGTLGRCVCRAVDSGASVAEAMDRLAEDLRRESRARVEGRARAVGVKAAVPLGVCMLPAFVLVGVVPLVASSVDALLRF